MANIGDLWDWNRKQLWKIMADNDNNCHINFSYHNYSEHSQLKVVANIK